jgi:hypothetical protein
MAAIPVTFVGYMHYTDVGVGGGPMPGGPFPSHPIAPGGPVPPLGTWGGRPPNYVDIGLPGPQPHPEHPIVIPPDAIAPGVPTHPIYIPVYPAHPIVIPPEAIGPGVPTHPIVLPPPHPAHPIVIPPDAIEPGVPTHPIVLPPVPPLGTWGGDAPWPGYATPPIYIPPVGDGGREPLVEWKVGWSPSTGWVVVGVPTIPHPVPSTK